MYSKILILPVVSCLFMHIAPLMPSFEVDLVKIQELCGHIVLKFLYNEILSLNALPDAAP